MNVLMKAVFIVALSVLPLSVSMADVAVAKRAAPEQGNDNCTMKKTTSVNMSFNLQNQPDLPNADTFMEDKIKEIETTAAELGITEIKIQSYNMNMSVNNYGSCGAGTGQAMYQINGNVNTQIMPAEKGPELLKALEAKGYSGSLYLNANRQCY